MAIFKRGRVYWYHFWFKDQHIQQSTRQGNPRVARQMEAAYRTALAKGEVGIIEHKPAPILKDFAQRFMDAIQVRCASKPRTVAYYAEKLQRLLEFEPMANARLDAINEALIESYVQERTQQVSPATVNRQLATLRRLLRLAYDWQVINRVPRIHMLPGERPREFVLTHQQEQLYLSMAPQPLHDVALLILDTGLRVGEALTLEWRDVHLEPANGSRCGYIHIREGKTKNARRNLSQTPRVEAMLRQRASNGQRQWVFESSTGQPYLVTSLDHWHNKARSLVRLPKDFVLHSLRHTMLTRLGESGVDVFSIMRIAGHSSVTVSQRYVHPSPESLERAFEKLEDLNARAAGFLSPASLDPKRQLPATVSATVESVDSVSPCARVAQVDRAAVS